MGRLVAAQRTCSRLDLFQDEVAGIMTHANNRNYPRRLMHSVWSRFLARYWDASSVTSKELRAWFHRAWNQVIAAGANSSTPQGGGSHPRTPWAMPLPPRRAADTLQQGSPVAPPQAQGPLEHLLEAMEEDEAAPLPPSTATAELAVAVAQGQATITSTAGAATYRNLRPLPMPPSFEPLATNPINCHLTTNHRAATTSRC